MMYDPISDLSQYNEVSDIEIIKRYRKERHSVYISVMLMRYEPLVLKVIQQWNRRNNWWACLTMSDYKDTLHCAYLGMILAFDRVKDVDSIKNVGSRIKSYVYYVLRQHYKHRRHEMPVEGIADRVVAPYHDFDSGILNGAPLGIGRIMYLYHYDYYKMALMMFGARSKKYMKTKFQRAKCKMRESVREYLRSRE